MLRRRMSMVILEALIKRAANENGGTFDGRYPDFNAWSVTDNITKSSFMVSTPEEIPARFAAARSRA
jgi:hypothetical protein